MSTISALSLLKQTVNRFRKYPGSLFKLGAWIFLPIIIGMIVISMGMSAALALVFAPNAGLPPSIVPLLFLLGIVCFIGSIWASVRLQRGVLFISAEHPLPDHDGREAFDLIPSFLWVQILFMLCTVALLTIAMLGWSMSNFIYTYLALSGSNPVAMSQMLNIVWGILGVIGGIAAFYLVPRLQFAIFSLLDQQRHGFSAIKDSWELTKGRWFMVVWCNLVMTVVILLISLVLSTLFEVIDKAIGLPIFSIVGWCAVATLVLVPAAVLYSAQLYHALRTNNR